MTWRLNCVIGPRPRRRAMKGGSGEGVASRTAINATAPGPTRNRAMQGLLAIAIVTTVFMGMQRSLVAQTPTPPSIIQPGGGVVLEIVVLPNGDTNVSVISGSAKFLDCERRRASVAAGQSGTVWAEGASCSEAEVVDGSLRPEVFAVLILQLDTTIFADLQPQEEGTRSIQLQEPDDLFENLEESQAQQNASNNDLK